MRRIKLEITYDGTRYKGWQRQADVPSIQGVIEKTLQNITKERIAVTGSGRTDAGVHALKQVAAFSTASTLSPDIFFRAINGFLPDDIRILTVEDVPMSFHPIRDALSKRYRYLIDDRRPFCPITRNYCWVYRKPLDLSAMQSAAEFLQGTHDFACFQSQGSPRETTVRTILDISVQRHPKASDTRQPSKEMETQRSAVPGFALIQIEVEADGFLYNMMRTIAGTLVQFSTKCFPPNRMKEIIASCDRKLAGPTAPPQGLYLADVIYGLASK